MIEPDEEPTFSFEDLDSADSGRDESGVMHRFMVRSKVGSWSFSYAFLTEAEKRYMEEIFGDASEFMFTHPDRLDSTKQVATKCYRSKYSLSWKNARTGIWKNYKFNIIEC
jgi:hypothetical protein